MAYSLKKMAEACIRAEAVYYNAGMDILPRFILRLKGRHDHEIVHVLTGTSGLNLTGLHLAYLPNVDKTLVLVKCYEIRGFLMQMNSAPEDYVDREWINKIYQSKTSVAYDEKEQIRH